MDFAGSLLVGQLRGDVLFVKEAASRRSPEEG